MPDANKARSEREQAELDKLRAETKALQWQSNGWLIFLKWLIAGLVLAAAIYTFQIPFWNDSLRLEQLKTEQLSKQVEIDQLDSEFALREARTAASEIEKEYRALAALQKQTADRLGRVVRDQRATVEDLNQLRQTAADLELRSTASELEADRLKALVPQDPILINYTSETRDLAFRVEQRLLAAGLENVRMSDVQTIPPERASTFIVSGSAQTYLVDRIKELIPEVRAYSTQTRPRGGGGLSHQMIPLFSPRGPLELWLSAN